MRLVAPLARFQSQVVAANELLILRIRFHPSTLCDRAGPGMVPDGCIALAMTAGSEAVLDGLLVKLISLDAGGVEKGSHVRTAERQEERRRESDMDPVGIDPDGAHPSLLVEEFVVLLTSDYDQYLGAGGCGAFDPHFCAIVKCAHLDGFRRDLHGECRHLCGRLCRRCSRNRNGQGRE